MATISATHSRYKTTKPRADFWPFNGTDYGILIAVAALLVIGLIMVYSSSFFVSLYYKQTISYYIRWQSLAALLGVAGLVVMQFFDYRFFRRVSTFAMLSTLLLLMVVLFVGDPLQGSTRGLWGGKFQPSEVAKLITIFYIADWLSSKGERIRDFGMGFIPFVVVVGIVGGLIAVQPDLSTAVLICLVAFTMFFVAGARWSHFIAVLLVGVLAVVFFISVFEHAADRWDAYWTMIQDPTEAEWHSVQVFYALARGGLIGQGLGNSFQKTGHLPVPHSDSILAVIGEELGLVGCLAVLGLLMFLGYRGYRIALETVNPYGRLLALGVTSWLVYQALINAAVITGIIPFTGLPLPFISYGGSSMATSLLGVGVLLNIAQQNKRLEAGLTRRAGRKNASAGLGRRNRRAHYSRAGYRS